MTPTWISDRSNTKAAIAPAFAWATLIGLVALAWKLESAAGTDAAIGRAVVVLLAAAGAGVLVVLRRNRGSTRRGDAVQAVLWAHPWHAPLCLGGHAIADLLATLVLSIAHACWSLGLVESRRVVLDAAVRFARSWQTIVGLGTVAALLAVARFVQVEPSATNDLDDSWQQVIGEALARGDQWGRDVVFTFGPLGYFTRGTYVAELYWTKVLWWELGLKSAIAIGLVCLSRRMSGPLEKTTFLVALLTASGGFDALNFMAITAAGCWLVATPAVGIAATTAVVAVATLVALTKFTSSVLFAAVVVAVALARWRRGTAADGARFLALAGIVFLVCWTFVAGQSPFGLPAWISSSLSVAAGHNQAMSLEGVELAADTAAATTLLALAGAIAILSALERARDATRWIASGLFALATFVAFKAGFTRHGHNAITFFAFVAVAPWFLLPARDPGRLAPVARPLLVFARIACAFVALVALGRLFGNPKPLPVQPFVVFVDDLDRAPARILGAAEHEEELQSLRAAAARAWNLPRTRAVVGRQPIDHFFFDQGIVLVNGFDYRPRPVFQSYAAYTPELLERNAARYRAADAPRFVTYRHETLDLRLPGLEDAPTQLILARDYRPVLSENGTLLLARDPRPGTPTAKLLVDREIAFFEYVDVAVLGGHVLAAIDVELTSAGEARRLLLRAPILWIDLELEDGSSVRRRFEPGMARTPFLISPFLGSQAIAQSYLLGQSVVGVRSFRLAILPEDDQRFEPIVRLRLFDGSDWAPRPVNLAGFAAASDDGSAPIEAGVREKDLRHPVLGPAAIRVRASREPQSLRLGGEDLLLTTSPCDLLLPLEAGPRRLNARFAVPEFSWRWASPKGCTLLVLARRADGVETRVAWRTLNPYEDVADRGFHELSVEIPGDEPRTLVIRLRPGTETATGKDLVVWSRVTVE